MSIAAYGFAQRAGTYARWDLLLQEKTRFFAAASVTNQLLSALAPITLSEDAVSILDDLGELLEDGNRRLAERTIGMRRSGVALDAWMVQTEQWWVARFLIKTARTAPTTLRRVTAELDLLLNTNVGGSLCAIFPPIFGYLSVLQHVKRAVAGPVQFTRLDHRVRIGQQLIARIRQGTSVQHSLSLRGVLHA